MRYSRLILGLIFSISCLSAVAQTISLGVSPSPAQLDITPCSATGKVTFYDGVTVVGIAPLVSGTAVLGTYSLGAGVHSLTAFYSGAKSSSAAETVNALSGGAFSRTSDGTNLR